MPSSNYFSGPTTSADRHSDSPHSYLAFSIFYQKINFASKQTQKFARPWVISAPLVTPFSEVINSGLIFSLVLLDDQQQTNKTILKFHGYTVDYK